MLGNDVRHGNHASENAEMRNAPASTQWTLKNIDRQTVELSRQAARKRGMKFGAWVAQVLREAADEHIEKKGGEEHRLLLSRIEELESRMGQRIEKIQKQGQEIQHDLRVLQLLVPAVAAK
jgi:uncharacterized protein YukE